jgi:hypothetical protein
MEYQRKWYKKNKKIHDWRRKQWAIKNAERQKQVQREYRQRDYVKQKYSEYNRKRYSNRKHQITSAEWIACKNYFDNACAYCGMTYEEHKKKLNKDLHKEHVIYDGRNDLKNCVPSCQSCNSEKHFESLNNWYNRNNPKYTYERYHRICNWLREGYKQFIQMKKRKTKNQINS